MGSYGIGVSRLVAAIIEAKYNNNIMRWPESVAPFDVAIIPSLQKNDKSNYLKAEKLYNSNQIKIIDIRTEKEWKMTGVIPNTFLVNMHNEDFTENPNFINIVKDLLNKNLDSKIAFICASGARSEIAANYFKNKKHKNIFHIPTGILGKQEDGWLYLGLPIESFNKEKVIN